MLLWLIAPLVRAATLTVCDTGCDFAGIQAAVDAADDGDLLFVSDPGAATLRTDSVRVGKRITIQSRNGLGKPWQSATAAAPAVSVLAGGDLTLRGFRLHPSAGAPAIHVEGGANLSLHDSELLRVPSAAFAWVELGPGATSTIQATRFDGGGSSASAPARAVFVGANASLDLDLVQMSFFQSCQGSGVLAVNAARVHVNGGRFTANRTLWCGGNAGDERGGSMRLVGVADASVQASLFHDNIAVVGAAINAEDTDLEVSRSVFRGNNPASFGGREFADGAALALARGSFSVSRSSFLSNYAGAGGAILVTEGNLSVEGSLFANNTAQTQGGAIRVESSDDFEALLELRGVSFRNNRADQGAAVYSGYQVALNVEGSSFIANELSRRANDPRGGALFVRGPLAGRVTANLFCENRFDGNTNPNTPRASVLYSEYHLDLALRYNLVVKNQALPGTSVIELPASRVDVAQNSFALNQGDADLAALLRDATEAEVASLHNNAFLRQNNSGATRLHTHFDPRAAIDGNVTWPGNLVATGFYDGSTTLAAFATQADPGWDLSGVCESYRLAGTNLALRTGGVDIGSPFGRHQGAPTLVDPSSHPNLPLLDHDGDGVIGLHDCDDTDPEVRPGAAERCDGVDNDCNGVPDWEDAALTGQGSQVFEDVDRDGYGAGAPSNAPCGIVPLGFAAEAGDCAPNDATRSPGVEEVPYNGIDDDCDLSTRDDDVDGDGFPVVLDCDDLDAEVHPGAAEVCDGVDQDCDDLVDEQPPEGPIWYEDADRDGFGAGPELRACEPPRNYVDTPGDCDDSNASVHPEATERCNGFDDDCDRETDVDAADATRFYRDGDGDGWGGTATVSACAQPPGFVTNDQDCDDSRIAAYPAAPETCNDLDDDCDEEVDEEAIDAQPWYADADGDGWGTGGATYACDPLPEHAERLGDCDDTDSDRNPEAIEVACNGVDEDCEPSTGETGCGDTGDSDSGDSDTGDSDTGDSDTGDSDTGDSSDTADSSDSEDTGDTDDSEPIPTFVAQLTGGAGCASAPSPGAWGLFGLLALGMPRRRA